MQNDKKEMLKSINKEIEMRQSYLNGNTISSIYFGGGTPSILNKQEIKSIISTIYHLFLQLKTNTKDVLQIHHFLILLM